MWRCDFGMKGGGFSEGCSFPLRVFSGVRRPRESLKVMGLTWQNESFQTAHGVRQQAADSSGSLSANRFDSDSNSKLFFACVARGYCCCFFGLAKPPQKRERILFTITREDLGEGGAGGDLHFQIVPNLPLSLLFPKRILQKVDNFPACLCPKPL